MEDGNRPPLPPLSENSKPNQIPEGVNPRNNSCNVADHQIMETMQAAMLMAAQIRNEFALRQYDMYRWALLSHNAVSLNSRGQDGTEIAAPLVQFYQHLLQTSDRQSLRLESDGGRTNAINQSSCNINQRLEEVLTKIQVLQEQMLSQFQAWSDSMPQPRSVPDNTRSKSTVSFEAGGPRIPTCPSRILAPPAKKTIFLPSLPAAQPKGRRKTSNSDDTPPTKRVKKDVTPNKRETGSTKQAVKEPKASNSWQSLHSFSSFQEAAAKTSDNGKSAKIRTAHLNKTSDQPKPPKIPTHSAQKVPQLSIQRAEDSALLLASNHKTITSKITPNLEKTLKIQKDATPSTSWQIPNLPSTQEALGKPNVQRTRTIQIETPSQPEWTIHNNQKIRQPATVILVDDFKPKGFTPEKSGPSTSPSKNETFITKKSPNLVQTFVHQGEPMPSTSQPQSLQQAASKKLDETNPSKIPPVPKAEPNKDSITKKCEVCGSSALLQNWYCQDCIACYARNVRAFENEFPINRCIHSGNMAAVCSGCRLGKFLALYKFHNPTSQIPLLGMIPRRFYECYRNGAPAATPDLPSV